MKNLLQSGASFGINFLTFGLIGIADHLTTGSPIAVYDSYKLTQMGIFILGLTAVLWVGYWVHDRYLTWRV